MCRSTLSLTSALDGVGCFTPRVRDPVHFVQEARRAPVRSPWLRKISPPTKFDPQTVARPYTDYDMPTHEFCAIFSPCPCGNFSGPDVVRVSSLPWPPCSYGFDWNMLGNNRICCGNVLCLGHSKMWLPLRRFSRHLSLFGNIL
jgi:hypothetical protein